jgi:hypothetical protein
MRTLVNINNNQQPHEWERREEKLHLLSRQLLSSVSSLRLFWQKQASAIRGWTVGNSLKVALNEVLSNNRVLVGIVLMAVGCVFYQAHLLFVRPEIPSILAFIPDPMVSVNVWYYKCWYYWFFTQREEFLIIFSLIGFFLMLPQKWQYRYILVPVVAFSITEIVYQSFITHWTEFYTTPDWQFLVCAPFAVYAIIKAVSYTVYRKYHLKDGNMARIKGIIRTPGIDTDTKLKYLMDLVKEQEEYNGRI